MLKVSRKFVEELKQSNLDYDEVESKIKTYIIDEYTKGYLICMLENKWSELEDDERVDDILSFVKRHIKD